MKTLVIGASENKTRYSNLAINMLRENGHEVVAIGGKEGKVADVSFGTENLPFEGVDTISLYLAPEKHTAIQDYLLSLEPRRIIFNPGTENVEMEQIAQKNGIDVLEACTLVLLRTHQF